MLAAKRSRAITFLPEMVFCRAVLGSPNTIFSDGGYRLQSGVAYGDHPRQKLDVYHSNNPALASPIIVFFYGGSWKSGHRSKYRFVADAWTRRGYTVAIPDYRLYPNVRFPAFMDDAASALRWIANNVADIERSKRPIFLVGHSAGAHIAALLSVDATYLLRHSLSPKDICGVIGLAGPYTLDPLKYRHTRSVFKYLNNRDDARPVAQVTAATPPFLLFHGEDDVTVNPSNTIVFAKKISENGGSVEAVLLPDTGHYKIILAVARPFDDIAPINNRIANFIEQHRGCRAA
ncbi:MAG: Carboxylesterase NlhH [Alphaproteobacteria bacterium MarineAlpha11_Bin1]|nr:MAG: Carboxylesterase NlhH [Alphaproteobacteria bacterium MarineAlpha11_Bin1]